MKNYTLYIKFRTLNSTVLSPDQYLLLEEEATSIEPIPLPSEYDSKEWSLANWWVADTLTNPIKPAHCSSSQIFSTYTE